MRRTKADARLVCLLIVQPGVDCYIQGDAHNPLLRLFLVEDPVALRDRLAHSLGSIAGIQIVGFSDTEQDAISQLRQLRCDARWYLICS